MNKWGRYTKTSEELEDEKEEIRSTIQIYIMKKPSVNKHIASHSLVKGALTFPLPKQFTTRPRNNFTKRQIVKHKTAQCSPQRTQYSQDKKRKLGECFTVSNRKSDFRSTSFYSKRHISFMHRKLILNRFAINPYKAYNDLICSATEKKQKLKNQSFNSKPKPKKFFYAVRDFCGFPHFDIGEVRRKAATSNQLTNFFRGI